MWRNWSPYVLLVEMKNGAATLESSTAVPQNQKEDRDMAQVVECLPRKSEALSSNPSTTQKIHRK
jgi:hypothetical protein